MFLLCGGGLYFFSSLCVVGFGCTLHLCSRVRVHFILVGLSMVCTRVQDKHGEVQLVKGKQCHESATNTEESTKDMYLQGEKGKERRGAMVRTFKRVGA